MLLEGAMRLIVLGAACSGRTGERLAKPGGKGLDLQVRNCRDPQRHRTGRRGFFDRNSSLEGNVGRAIDFHEGDKLDEKALKALIRAAVALTRATGRQHRQSPSVSQRVLCEMAAARRTMPTFPVTPFCDQVRQYGWESFCICGGLALPRQPVGLQGC